MTQSGRERDGKASIPVGLLSAAGLAGIVGPIFFLVVITIVGFLTPGYSPISQLWSDLTHGSQGWKFSLALAPFGISILIFSSGLHRAFSSVISTRQLGVITALLVVSGIGALMAAVFTVNYPVEHSFGGVLLFFLPTIAQVLVGRRLRKIPAWNTYGTYSLISGVIFLAVVTFFFFHDIMRVVPSLVPLAIAVDTQYFGVFQRFISPSWVWFCVTGRVLIRQGQRENNTYSTSISTEQDADNRINRGERLESRRQPLNLYCLWAGIIGPVLYLLVFTIHGYLTPGYSAVGLAVSYLLLGPTGWIEVANFIGLGLLLMLFAAGFYRLMGRVIKQSNLRASTLFLFLAGLGFIIAGIFVPEAPGQSATTINAMLHMVGFEFVFLSLPMACFIMGMQLRKTVGWSRYGWYSIVTGLITILPGLLNLVSPFGTSLTPPPNAGLFERILVVEALAWYVIFSLKLISLQSRDVANSIPLDHKGAENI